MATPEEVINGIRNRLTLRLQEKPGWGRNEVLAAFERSVMDTLMELLEREARK